MFDHCLRFHSPKVLTHFPFLSVYYATFSSQYSVVSSSRGFTLCLLRLSVGTSKVKLPNSATGTTVIPLSTVLSPYSVDIRFTLLRCKHHITIIYFVGVSVIIVICKVVIVCPRTAPVITGKGIHQVIGVFLYKF